MLETITSQKNLLLAGSSGVSDLELAFPVSLSALSSTALPYMPRIASRQTILRHNVVILAPYGALYRLYQRLILEAHLST